MSEARAPLRGPAVLVEAGRLAAAGEPFVLATVVTVRRPASARRGDLAVVTPDGELRGWVGGACSEPAVVREALRALAEGSPRLLRICPPGAVGDAADVVIAESSCASEGTVEVLVEPQLPTPLLAVIGESPAAATLRELAAAIGWRVTHELEPGSEAIVIATMGRGDADALEQALATGAGYIGLVASSRRAAVELARLRERGLGDDALTRVRSPAGLDLGPLGQPEIAVAVLAELVAWRRLPTQEIEAPLEAVDPVCGMTVAVTADAPSVEHDGVRYWFCCPGCRGRFAAEPARFLTAT